jgi:hypothetical protein
MQKKRCHTLQPQEIMTWRQNIDISGFYKDTIYNNNSSMKTTPGNARMLFKLKLEESTANLTSKPWRTADVRHKF